MENQNNDGKVKKGKTKKQTKNDDDESKENKKRKGIMKQPKDISDSDSEKHSKNPRKKAESKGNLKRKSIWTQIDMNSENDSEKHSKKDKKRDSISKSTQVDSSVFDDEPDTQVDEPNEGETKKHKHKDKSQSKKEKKRRQSSVKLSEKQSGINRFNDGPTSSRRSSPKKNMDEPSSSTTKKEPSSSTTKEDEVDTMNNSGSEPKSEDLPSDDEYLKAQEKLTESEPVTPSDEISDSKALPHKEPIDPELDTIGWPSKSNSPRGPTEIDSTRLDEYIEDPRFDPRLLAATTIINPEEIGTTESPSGQRGLVLPENLSDRSSFESKIDRKVGRLSLLIPFDESTGSSRMDDTVDSSEKTEMPPERPSLEGGVERKEGRLSLLISNEENIISSRLDDSADSHEKAEKRSVNLSLDEENGQKQGDVYHRKPQERENAPQRTEYICCRHCMRINKVERGDARASHQTQSYRDQSLEQRKECSPCRARSCYGSCHSQGTSVAPGVKRTVIFITTKCQSRPL